MAHLNLRDRVIETTIAYVGAEPSSGATNLAQVKGSQVKGEVGQGRAGVLEETQVGGERLLALDWRPRDGAKLNDCELKVKLVSTSSAVESSAMQSILVDADGLVLVLESDPAASDGNRRAIAAVHEVLAKDPQKRMPVVVQLNQREGVVGTAGVDALGDETWPRLEACVDKGDGVMETLQRAVDVVVESMQGGPLGKGGDVVAPRATAGLRAEGNPLLAALRQILQATVSEQFAALEARLVETLESRVAEKVEKQMRPALSAIEARMERVDGAVVELGQRVNELGQRVNELGQRVKAAAEKAVSRTDVEQIEARAAASDAALGKSVEERFSSFDAWMDRLESTVIAAGERSVVATERAASRGDLERIELRMVGDAGTHREALVTELKDHRKSVREEVTRALGAATLPLQRALDALAVETKKQGASTAATATADLSTAIERFGAKNETLETQVSILVQESRSVAGQVDDLVSQIEHVDAHVARRIAEIRDALAALHEKTDGRAEALQTELGALTAELKKKKSWFS